MSSPIALGRPAPFPLTPNSDAQGAGGSRIQFGDSALTAPTTPGKRVPVIDKTKVDPELRKAAEGMEAMFLDYMMKVMRETVPKSEMDLESPATAVYRSMQDTETAQRAARAGGVGLADQLIAYLESQRYTLPRGQGAPYSKPAESASVGGRSSGTGVEAGAETPGAQRGSPGAGSVGKEKP